MTIGIIGLGKMGSRIAGKLAAGGHTVHVWNRTADVSYALAKNYPTLIVHETIEDLVRSMPATRIIWMMVLATVIEEVFQTIVPQLSQRDILIDAGNCRFQDTDRRAKVSMDRGVRYMGIGVSGGVLAQKNGYACMVGGDQTAYEEIQPILETLAAPHSGHAYFGPGGAGHFVKMIHNGIEYGMMQSLAEGFDVLKHAPYAVDLAAVAKVWQKGSIVSGFLLDRTQEILATDQTLEWVVGKIGALGEGEWTVEQAKVEHIPVPVIQASLEYRTQSQRDAAVQQSFTAKLVTMMRNAFGGHAVEKK